MTAVESSFMAFMTMRQFDCVLFYIFCCKRLLDFAKFFFYIDAIIISVSPFALVIWLCMLIDFHTKYLHINIYYCYFFLPLDSIDI